MRVRAVLVLLVLVPLSSCSEGDPPAPPLPPTTSTTIGTIPLDLGMQATTAIGNLVRVVEWDPGPVPPGLIREPASGHRYAAAAVEGCAGDAGYGIRLRPSQFALQLEDGTEWQSTVPAKRPRLEEDRVLGRGECATGWVTFEIPDAAAVSLVLFASEPLTYSWRVP